MTVKTNKLKGRAKEAVGTVTGNEDLESEGKAQRQAGEVEQTIDHVKGRIEEFVEKAGDKGEETAKKIGEARK